MLNMLLFFSVFRLFSSLVNDSEKQSGEWVSEWAVHFVDLLICLALVLFLTAQSAI